ncbi:MAG: ABC transporter permease [Xanthomonadales bacterium]|nr:ABC transporter permease [Xanthomonadales bacterium]
MRREWIAFLAIARRELRRILRIWGQTLVPPAITMALYFVVFGTLIGARIGEVEGVAYIDFIVPGLVMMSVITNAYGNVSSSFFGAKFGRYVEEFLVAPVSPLTVLLGYLAGALLRGVLVGALVIAVALFFTPVRVAHPLPTLAALVLAALIFGLAGLINAIYAKKFDDISIVPTFVLTPLTYLGGVFFSVGMLPSPWRELALANPILYVVNAFRYGMLGVGDVPLGVAFALMLLLAGVLGVVAVRLLTRGVGLRS